MASSDAKTNAPGQFPAWGFVHSLKVVIPIDAVKSDLTSGNTF